MLKVLKKYIEILCKFHGMTKRMYKFKIVFIEFTHFTDVSRRMYISPVFENTPSTLAGS